MSRHRVPCEHSDRGAMRCAQRRGFAMPVVLVLLLVVSMVSSVVLLRQASDRLVSQRRLVWYREHHAKAGLEEVINAWLRSLPRNLDLDEALGEDDHALTIDLGDGTEALIYLRDGESTLLVDGSALPPDQASRVERAVARFDQLVGDGRRPQERRRVGAWKISPHRASPEALEAVASAYGSPDAARRFAVAIVEARQAAADGRIDNDALTQALAIAEFEDAEAQLLRGAITLRTTLRFVVIELRPKGAMRQREAGSSIMFGGYIPVSARREAGMEQRSGFLSFERLSVQ